MILTIFSCTQQTMSMPEDEPCQTENPWDTEDYPKFPWPPPKASASVKITDEVLSSSIEKVVYLGDIDKIINKALKASEYWEMSYYAVPDGFALVTRLEQINSDGTPKEEQDRWSMQVPPMRKFTLMNYLKALFTANPGHFRILVFIVTPKPFSKSDETVDRKEAMDWLERGLNKLPQPIASKLYTNQCEITVLIYEFEQPESGETILKQPSHLSGRKHIEQSGLISALEL